MKQGNNEGLSALHDTAKHHGTDSYTKIIALLYNRGSTAACVDLDSARLYDTLKYCMTEVYVPANGSLDRRHRGSRAPGPSPLRPHHHTYPGPAAFPGGNCHFVSPVCGK